MALLLSLLPLPVQVAAAKNLPHASGCDIKGNVSSRGTRIYHLPGTKSYTRTKISKLGERWFCSETEAKEAGWRASRSKKMAQPETDARDCLEPKKHPPGKLIKGNFGSSGKIYHILCSPYYFETRVDVKKGDKWFASPEQADRAGWSKAGGLWRGTSVKIDLTDCQRPKDKHPKGCDIKGNISRSGKIYHIRGSKFYFETKIRTKKKERWFCSETQAIAAGWRAPKNLKRVACPN